jgi:hypothetical protein
MEVGELKNKNKASAWTRPKPPTVRLKHGGRVMFVFRTVVVHRYPLHRSMLFFVPGSSSIQPLLYCQSALPYKCHSPNIRSTNMFAQFFNLLPLLFDILFCVFEYLDQRDLLSLCLASKFLNSAATLVLFRNVDCGSERWVDTVSLILFIHALDDSPSE